jgi:hypothetical protein
VTGIGLILAFWGYAITVYGERGIQGESQCSFMTYVIPWLFNLQKCLEHQKARNEGQTPTPTATGSTVTNPTADQIISGPGATSTHDPRGIGGRY